MSLLPTRNLLAGRHAVTTLSLTTSQYWTSGFDGRNGHTENCPLLSESLLIIFIVECLYACISPRFSDKYTEEIAHYMNLRDSITDFETDYPGLASSSRALNKLSKVVRTSELIEI